MCQFVPLYSQLCTTLNTVNRKKKALKKIYLFFCEDRFREDRQREIFSICWVLPQVVTMAGVELI